MGVVVDCGTVGERVPLPDNSMGLGGGSHIQQAEVVMGGAGGGSHAEGAVRRRVAGGVGAAEVEVVMVGQCLRLTLRVAGMGRLVVAVAGLTGSSTPGHMTRTRTARPPGSCPGSLPGQQSLAAG